MKALIWKTQCPWKKVRKSENRKSEKAEKRKSGKAVNVIGEKVKEHKYQRAATVIQAAAANANDSKGRKITVPIDRLLLRNSPGQHTTKTKA